LVVVVVEEKRNRRAKWRQKQQPRRYCNFIDMLKTQAKKKTEERNDGRRRYGHSGVNEQVQVAHEQISVALRKR
jgi:hypothetical protein